MSQFRIKNNKYFRIDKGSSKVINNNIITDKLALEFLEVDQNRIKHFERFPDNWQELLNGGTKEVVEDFEDTEEEAEARKFYMEKKLPELREEFPDIKQISKDEFITDILKARRNEATL